MRRDQFLVPGIVGLVACLGWFYLSPTAADQSISDKSKSIVDAAEGAYKAADERYHAGKATIEDIYCWSQRLKNAQEADGKHPNAKADHLSRMEDLQKLTEERYKHGVPESSTFDIYATSYYVMEARANTKN